MRKVRKRPLIDLMFLFLATTATSMVYASQEEPWKPHSLLPESWARKSAITKVMPIYPQEAVQQGVSGLVNIKFETSPEGEVLRIKVKPRTDPTLTKAVAYAVKQWKFKPRLGPEGLSQSVISRLIFRFNLRDGEPRVEMYDPGPRPPDVQNLGYYNSAKEMREWREWKEVSMDGSTP